MTVLFKRRANGHPILVTLPTQTVVSGSDDLAFLLGIPGAVSSTPSTGTGTGSGTTTPNAGMAQNLTLANWGSGTSLGFHKRGVWFKKADVPAGQIPALNSGTAQLYGLRYWSDGSLKTARMLLRDTSFAGGESRTYTMSAVTGSPPSGGTALVGNTGLASAIAGHDFKVTFSSVTKNDGTNTTAYGSGAFTASLTNHATTSSRWTRLTSGAVADVWQGWGMAVDSASSTADAHLKINWYVTRWKNADGSTASFQIGAVVTQDWWSVTGKYLLSYNATLADGASTVVSYTGVSHPYQSQWLMAVNDGSNNVGCAPWIGAAQPTLFAALDKTYLVSTNLIPPLRTSKTPAAESTPTYTPCGNMEHRANIDGTGGYLGRGIVTEPDAVAFMRNDAQSYARARVNALAGLSVPYHYRSNRTRTRPGESAADTANTSIALIMAPKAASYYDFTAAGMPVAVDAYNGGNSPAASRDGWIAASGGTGVWSISGDSSHAVSYCYFMALITGDEWLLEAQIDLALNLAHQSIYGYHNFRQPFAIEFNSATPSDYYSGLLGQFQADNMRALGWAQLIQGHAFGLVPADHVAFGYYQALLAHNGDYVGVVLDNLPPDFAAAGAYYPNSELGMESLTSPWMIALIAGGAYAHYLCNEDMRWKRLGDFAANWTLRNASVGAWYMFDTYRAAHRYKRAAWSATSNPMLPGDKQPYVTIAPDLKASTGVFTMNGAVYWNSENQTPPWLTNGDVVVFTSQQQINLQGTIPTGAAEGQLGYIVNLQNGNGITGAYSPTNPPSFQIANTPGGTPLSWTADTSAVNLAWRPQAAANYPVAQTDGNLLDFPYLPNWDNYVPIHAAVIMLARQAGNTAATQAIHDGVVAFMAPMTNAYYAAYDMLSA